MVLVVKALNNLMERKDFPDVTKVVTFFIKGGVKFVGERVASNLAKGSWERKTLERIVQRKNS